jgi:protein-S-isoprenylcysteine O-methyltransferase Ste14
VRKGRAALGSFLFFLIAPGVVAGYIPWTLTLWRVGTPYPIPLRLLGGVLIAAGVPVLVQAFVRFVREGAGTPAPVAPTERLVIGGLYRYVRNPMYLAVLSIIVGQGLLLGQPNVFAYAGAVAFAFVSFVLLYEEPALRRKFGEEYDRYRRAVPGWWPRLRPWTGK